MATDAAWAYVANSDELVPATRQGGERRGKKGERSIERRSDVWSNRANLQRAHSDTRKRARKKSSSHMLRSIIPISLTLHLPPSLPTSPSLPGCLAAWLPFHPLFPSFANSPIHSHTGTHTHARTHASMHCARAPTHTHARRRT